MIGLLAMAAVAGSSGYFISGNNLYTICLDQSLGYQCLGFIEGVADQITLENEIGNKAVICVPDSVVASQAKDVVIKYLREHPEKRNLSGSLVTMLAFGAVWPCK